jgi:AcrR family transcriptional regulator
MGTTDKRRRILEAMEKVLQGKRLDEVKVDQVAEAAGVGKGTVYLYFEDKEDLFLQMIEKLLQEESADVTEVAVSGLNPREKLLQVGETMSRHIMRKGQFIRMMRAQGRGRKNGDAKKMMCAHHQRLDQILTMVFEEVADAGILRPDLKVEAVVCLFKGMILQRSMNFLNFESDIPIQDLLDLMMEGAGKN